MRPKLKNIQLLFVFAAILLVWTGCKPVNPARQKVRQTEYNLGYQEAYGQYYDSVPLNVFGLDLYSEGLRLNKQGKMEGTGLNLYLSDIFVPDETLPAGTYMSDSVPRAYTFLPGEDFDGTPHGAYLLEIEDAKISSITVFHHGGFRLQQDGDTTDISLWFVEKKDTVYRAHYRGKLRKK